VSLFHFSNMTLCPPFLFVELGGRKTNYEKFTEFIHVFRIGTWYRTNLLLLLDNGTHLLLSKPVLC
jgi:hypothetical protein